MLLMRNKIKIGKSISIFFFDINLIIDGLNSQKGAKNGYNEPLAAD